MAVIGKPRNFHQKFKFIVEIDGFGETGFQDCSEIKGTHAEVLQWQGGGIIPDKQPGRLTIADVTLSRGATADKDMYDWFREVSDAASGGGQISPRFKRNLDVVQLDRDNTVLRRWRLFNAWPKEFVAGDWDNDADENVIESLMLSYDYFKPL